MSGSISGRCKINKIITGNIISKNDINGGKVITKKNHKLPNTRKPKKTKQVRMLGGSLLKKNKK